MMTNQEPLFQHLLQDLLFVKTLIQYGVLKKILKRMHQFIVDGKSRHRHINSNKP
jgi:hypothetical protein